MPISIPVIEMVEIGAGGGSIASIDSMNQIRIGPHSAGSEPGPACYQRGGVRPTVTDADLILGRLDPDNFANGAIPLSVEASAKALIADVGSHINLDDKASAYGVSEVVDENMANAARAHAVENGLAIEDFTMIAFGGAAPIHAARLGEKLGIKRVIIPPSAGVGSAVGFLKAPFGYEVIRSAFMRVDEVTAADLNKIFDEISAETVAFLEQGVDNGTVHWERRAFMRYVGQGWEIPVDLPARVYVDEDRELIKQLFDDAYARFFGRTVASQPVEIVSLTVKASSELPPVAKVALASTNNVVASTHIRTMFDAGLGEEVQAQIHERTGLKVGDCVVGPAIVVEAETSTVITSSYAATVQADRSLLLEMRK